MTTIDRGRAEPALFRLPGWARRELHAALERDGSAA